MESIKKIKKNKEIVKLIDLRLKEFSKLKNKNSKEWFSELCFCLLTANSKAKTAINIQNELGSKKFIEAQPNQIKKCIIKNKHRFHNNKTNYIIEARQFVDIKTIIKKIADENEVEAREWLVKNIKGLGYKESSHFLRNIGYTNLAILDRHILNFMHENSMIHEKPKVLSKKMYLELENILKKLAKKLKMSLAKLDLYLWYVKTGEVLK